MFTTEEEALLRRMLLLVGWAVVLAAVCLIGAGAVWLLRRG